jgi:uncharacterized protein
MQRKNFQNLLGWFKKVDRKPLIIRGARQVGKTWLVRNLAQILNLDLLELNFERDSNLKTLFSENDPKKTLVELEVFFNRNIDVTRSLLFLDEIQAAPELISKLRWFAEEKPQLAVIATGSLLDFVLDEHEFSMPVGRINYMHLEPLSFEEFLLALGQNKLCDFLNQFNLTDNISATIHEHLLQFFREYILVGGLPAAVDSWVKERSLIKTHEVQQNLLSTYKDDFSRYAKKLSHDRLNEVFNAIPRLLGSKFKYSVVNKDVQSVSIKNALNLLCKARLCHKVFASTASGIPLEAGIKDNIFKVILFDVGLLSSIMGLPLYEITKLSEINFTNEGPITEQVIGQLLRTLSPYYLEPKLCYWIREQRGSEAEVDYLTHHEEQIIPIEVKSGTTGTLRSLHGFMKQKGLKKAVRFNSDYASVAKIQIHDHTGDLVEYQLISLPLYMVEQMPRLIESVKSEAIANLSQPSTVF